MSCIQLACLPLGMFSCRPSPHFPRCHHPHGLALGTSSLSHHRTCRTLYHLHRGIQPLHCCSLRFASLENTIHGTQPQMHRFTNMCWVSSTKEARKCRPQIAQACTLLPSTVCFALHWKGTACMEISAPIRCIYAPEMATQCQIVCTPLHLQMLYVQWTPRYESIFSLCVSTLWGSSGDLQSVADWYHSINHLCYFSFPVWRQGIRWTNLS